MCMYRAREPSRSSRRPTLGRACGCLGTRRTPVARPPQLRAPSRRPRGRVVPPPGIGHNRREPKVLRGSFSAPLGGTDPPCGRGSRRLVDSIRARSSAVEQRTFNPSVQGSNPCGPTNAPHPHRRGKATSPHRCQRCGSLRQAQGRLGSPPTHNGALAGQSSSRVLVSPSGRPSSRALSRRRMILPERVFGRWSR